VFVETQPPPGSSTLVRARLLSAVGSRPDLRLRRPRECCSFYANENLDIWRRWLQRLSASRRPSTQYFDRHLYWIITTLFRGRQGYFFHDLGSRRSIRKAASADPRCCHSTSLGESISLRSTVCSKGDPFKRRRPATPPPVFQGFSRSCFSVPV